MKTTLTDRALKALKAAAPGTRPIIWDGIVPSFGARVTDKGVRTFIVKRRLGEGGPLVTVTLGRYPAVTLEQARTRARAAIADLGKGEHPREKAEAERRENERRRANTFEAVAGAFIDNHVAKLRSRKVVEAAIRADLVTRWGRRPITSITRSDVIEVIRDITGRRGPYAAHRLLAYVSKMWNWAIAQDLFGLEHSPADHVKPRDLIGRKEVRQRILTDDEVRLFWRATADVSDPFNKLAQFLLVTGQRLHECSDMSWSEVDLEKGLWTIPPGRMKADAPHAVPLSTEASALLESLPRGKESDFVFTTTEGRRPISGFSKMKARLDAVIRQYATGELAHWQLHDLRRTARTHFSALPSQDLVRELAIAHTRPGLHKVYDQFAYLDEKRALFVAWGKRLMAIVEPPDDPKKVVPMRRVAGWHDLTG